MKLEDIANINIGVVLKRKEATYNGEKAFHYKTFNIRCFEEDIEYDDFYSMEDLNGYVTQKGDLIFRLSLPSKIILVDEATEDLLISNLYCIIRPNIKKINPEFLKWFLESKNSRIQLEKFVIGTQVKAIPVAKLRLLEIPEVKIEEQEKIAKLIYNWEMQKNYYNKIVNEKESYYNSIISKVIYGGNK
jgi:restriction endonuclease S subunit